AESASCRAASGGRSGATADAGAAPSMAEHKRALIAAAACRVIARKGFANATIREIADAADMHVPTLYQYVDSKDEILELVYRMAMDRLQVDIGEAVRGLRSSRDKIRATIDAMVTSCDRNRAMLGVLNRELRSLPAQARTRVLQHYQGFMDRIASLIEEGIARGEFRRVDPNVIANVIDAVADMRALRPFSLDRHELDDYKREVADFVDRGLLRIGRRASRA
ncbi:MAG TPA: TetR family transcriptional regulator, partial [Burkholderiaceae bacterium]|nr:TetR family transcriptional regulator [Burkholderiaceae bacterium]